MSNSKNFAEEAKPAKGTLPPSNIDAVWLERTLEILSPYKQEYERAFYMGSGEGFIISKLPAKTIDALGLIESDLVEMPENVFGVKQPEGEYDLVVCMGLLYRECAHNHIYKTIMRCAKKYVLIGGAEHLLLEKDFGTELISYSFPYHNSNKKLTLYRIPSPII